MSKFSITPLYSSCQLLILLPCNGRCICFGTLLSKHPIQAHMSRTEAHKNSKFGGNIPLACIGGNITRRLRPVTSLVYGIIRISPYSPLFIVDTGQVAVDDRVVWTQIESSQIRCNSPALSHRSSLCHVQHYTLTTC